MTEEITSCFVCGRHQPELLFEGKDFFLTGETFRVMKCGHCGFLYTMPRPGPEVIGRYYESQEYISHSGTSKGLVNTLYLLVRNFTLGRKVRLIRRLKPEGKILDIGCATGEFLAMCREHHYEPYGVEPSRQAREAAASKLNLYVDPEEMLAEYPEGFFDVITLWHVLEHVHDLNGRIREISRVLKPDGVLIIAVPNSQSADSQAYKKFWAAWDLPRHLYHFSRESLNNLFVKHLYRIEKVIPMKFDAFYVSMLSEKYKRGHPDYLRGILNGFRSNISACLHQKNYSSLIFVLKKETAQNKPL